MLFSLSGKSAHRLSNQVSSQIDVQLVATAGGVTVACDPPGKESTKPGIPEGLRLIQEESKQFAPAVAAANAAYRAAHPNRPTSSNPHSLAPYFNSQTEAAVYLELVRRAGEFNP